MVHLMSDFKIDFNDSMATVTGQVGFNNITSIFDATSAKNLKVIDFTGLSLFDTALVVLICQIKRESKHIRFLLPSDLKALVGLYGVEGYIE